MKRRIKQFAYGFDMTIKIASATSTDLLEKCMNRQLHGLETFSKLDKILVATTKRTIIKQTSQKKRK